MIGCPDVEQLAAAATGELGLELRDELGDHVAACERCRGLLADQVTLRDLARHSPPPQLAAERRTALAAEVLAQADLLADLEAATAIPRRRRQRLAVAVGVTLAAAAAAIIVLATRQQAISEQHAASGSSGSRTNDAIRPDPRTPDGSGHRTANNASGDRTADSTSDNASGNRTADNASDNASGNRTADTASGSGTSGTRTADTASGSGTSGTRTADTASGSRTSGNRTPDSKAQVSGAGNSDFQRDTTPARDLVTLRDGQVAVDAVRARPVHVVAGTTRVEIASARASIAARKGVIESVSVFAGSVEITVDNRRHVIEAGMVWERDAATLEADAPLRAFREGWTALRAGKFADAIAAFDRAVVLDRAVDPVVAEDAAYWAAIASERAGDRPAAVKRYTDFLAKFPQSPRADAARAALKR